MIKVSSSSDKTKLPPSAKTPEIFLAIQAIFDQFGTLEKYHNRYGEIFYMPKSRMMPPSVIFSNPRGIEKLFTADSNLFETDPQSTAPVKVLFGENSLILLDGIKHQRHRKLLMPAFHGERMKSYSQAIVGITKEVISQWRVGQTICIRDYTQEISLRIILYTIFGLNTKKIGDYETSMKHDYLQNILVNYLNIFNSPLNSFFLLFPALQKDLGPLTPWSKFLKRKRQIKEMLQEECDLRRKDPNAVGEDILSLLIEARYEDGQPMSDEEIRDELITMLFAGHETTASSLAWSFYWLHRLPEIGQKLQTDLNSLSENAEFNDVMKLPYLNAVVLETLRLNPVLVFVSRRLKQPFKLMGYQFEPGTSLLPCIYLTHQRKDIYFEPKKFKPERFLIRQFSPYEFLPFGGGNRRCLGYSFALLEMKLVLGTIISEVELELLDNRPLKPARRGFTFTPEGGIKMRVKRIK
jgi:cytochrome P450 family 110